MALDGAIVAAGPRGRREIAARDLYLGPLSTSLGADELAVEARLPLPPAGAGWGFAEVARRHGDFALAGAAALLGLDGAGRVSLARLALFGVGPTPVRAAEAETALVGRAPDPASLREAAHAGAAPLRPDGDIHASAEYRRRVAAVLAERVLTAAADRARRAA